MCENMELNFPRRFITIVLFDYEHAMVIRDILLEDIELLRNWLEMKDYFLLKAPDKLEIEGMLRGGRSLSDAILKTLTLWISSMGRAATFQACVEILQSRNFVMSVENLRKRQSAIQNGIPKNIKLAPVSFHVDLPCLRFTGRVQELDTLHKMLTRSGDLIDGRIELRLTVVSGLGGVGKTSLARAYAAQFKDFYQNVVWINAETKRSVLSSFQDLAKHLRILQSNNALNEDELLNLLLNKLYAYLSTAKTLIIFDNAEEFKGKDGIHRFFPRSEPSNFLYILVTTRKLDLTLDGEILSLDVLTEEESIEFMLKWFRVQHDLEEIRKLVILLHRLPLALEQAGAYIARLELLRSKRSGGLSLISQYIQNYESNAKIILDNTFFQQLTLSTYEKTTLVTWRNTFDRIQKELNGELAILLMEVVAYLGSDNIPAKLLMNIRHILAEPPKIELNPGERNISWLRKSILIMSCWGKSRKPESRIPESQTPEWYQPTRHFLESLKDEDVDQCLDLLKSYSMLSELEGGLSVHRLVQHTVQINIGLIKETHILKTAIQIFEITFQVDEYNSFQAKCTEHSSILLKKLESHDLLLKEFPSFASTVCRLVDYCANHEDLLALATKFVPKYNALFGSNSVQAIEMGRHFVWALRRLGRLNDAMDAVQITLSTSVNSLGSIHWLTLDLKNIHATILVHLKRYVEAVPVFDAVIEGYKELEGEHSLNAVTVLHNKAECLSQIEVEVKDHANHAEAAEMYRQVYEIRRVTLGEDHPFTLSSKYNLARESFRCFENDIPAPIDNEKVLQYLAEVSEKFKSTIGEGHPQTLKASVLGVYISLIMGKNESTEQLCLKLLEHLKRALGERDRLTLTTRHNLAVSIAQQGRSLEALKMCEELYPILVECLGESHQCTTRSAWWIEKLRKG